MDLTEAIKEAYTYADHNVSLFETLELTHDNWSDSIMLVDSPVYLTTNEGVYNAVTFDIVIPEVESAIRGQLKVTIKFLPTEYREMLFAAAPEAEQVMVYYRQYMEGDSDPQAELPVAMTVNRIDFTRDETVITALYPDLVNIKICRRNMTATEFPGARV